MITRDNIINLAKRQHGVCASIYFTTNKMGEEVQQYPSSLKNLLTDAKRQLEDQDLKEEEIKKLLEEPRKLLDQPLFWQHNDKRLALFICDESFDYYRVPYSFKDRAMVSYH